MDIEVWRKFPVVEEYSYKCTTLESYIPREIFCGVHWCMQSRTWRSSYARQPRNMLWVKKVEGAWEELCHSWSGTCIHSTRSQYVEALLDGQKIWAKDRPLWSEVFVWSANSKMLGKLDGWSFCVNLILKSNTKKKRKESDWCTQQEGAWNACDIS